MREEIIKPPPHDTDETRALATLGRLTRGALHELSNPLVALLGSAELALADLEPGTKLHDRISLTHRTGTEVVEIVRALQGFVRLQGEPPQELSVGAAAADAIALVERVLPTHDVELSTRGDATTVAEPGEIRRRLVDLLVAALASDGHPGAIELVVGDGIVTATGGGELRF
jgi:two-component system, cell cycle sensor histidine kinase and response regulator CckA